MATRIWRSFPTTILILIVATVLRITSLNQSFWLDETVQATLSRNFSSIAFAKDFHPPLFYLLTSFWQSLGFTSEVTLRMLSVLAGVLTIWIGMKIAEEVGGRKVALWTGLLMSVNPYHVYFSQEYRMYAFFGLLTAMSWHMLLKEKWKSYALTIIALSYTHYFAVIVLASQALWVFWQRKELTYKYIRYTLFGLLPFVFWIRTFLDQLHTSVILREQLPQWKDLLSQSSIRFIPLLFIKLFIGILSPEPRWLYGAMVLATLLVLGTAAIVYLRDRHKFNLPFPLVFCWVVVPIISAWLISFVTPVASLHRFAFVIPGLCIGPALLISDRKDFFTQALLGMTILLFSGASLMYLSDSRYQREDWRTAISFTDDLIQQTETSGLVIFPQKLAPLEWYSQTPEKYVPITKGKALNQESIESGIREVEKNKRLVVYRYLSGLTDPAGVTFRILKEHGYKEVTSYNFRGVGIVDLYIKD